MGVLWESVVAAAGAALVGGVAAKRALSWARRRCDEALAGAADMPAPTERSFALVATTGPVSRARTREQRALQRALDQRRDGALLARCAVPPRRPPHHDPAA